MADDDRPLADGYAVHEFGESCPVTADDVRALWVREGAVVDEEAQRRVDDVRLVATHHGVPVGVSSLYLRSNAQLRADFWHQRIYVAIDDRLANLSYHLAVQTLELLERDFVNGTDTRGAGIIYEPENASFARYYNQGLWPWTSAVFIGVNARQHHVYVRWFEGARVPGA